jgi:hypothetical protein
MKNRAHLFGAILGVFAMTGFLVWRRTQPGRCTGGVTFELHPPLGDPGSYHFVLSLDGIPQPCVFDVPLPVKGRVDTSGCGHVVEMKTRVEGTTTKITGLTIGASPDELTLRVTRKGEVLYDTRVVPSYGPYETPREESRLFCGERALVTPPCVRGSSACWPYEPTCDGPEDCPVGKVCCLNPELGREYGASAATECTSRSRCLDGFGSAACHGDGDCPNQMTCSDSSLAKHFKRAVAACRPAAR